MKKLTLLSLLFLTLFACRNDIDEMGTAISTPEPPVTTNIDYTPDVEEVTATLFGIVTDEDGNPINGASVKLDNSSINSDDAGRFIFKDITMNKLGTFVQVKKDGYFNASHRFFPTEGSVNYVTIAMLVKDNSGTFTSSEGGSISTTDGVAIDFPANSIIDASGASYDGAVEVFAKWIDPTAGNLLDVMPGNLQGININEEDVFEEVALASYGMVAVELESPSGESLNLGNDLNATITFPVPDELLGDAPTEIPLWSFNEEFGIWVEEGSATLVGDTYVGEVSHFSFWNCDYPYPLINLTGRVVSVDGTPLPYVYVSLTMSNGGVGVDCTNSEGIFSGKVPKDEEFLMEIYQWNGCGFVHTETIGPFSADTDLGDIVIDEPDLLEINGTIVNCAGDLVTNGWVNMTLDGTTYNYYIYDGTFSASVYNCNNVTELTLTAGDLDNFVTSGELTFTIVDPLNIGAVEACDVAITEFFTVTIDGVTTTFPDPYLSINPGPDSTWFGSGYIPGGNDFSFDINMITEITGTGTYTNADVRSSNFFLPISAANGGTAWMNCFNGGGQGDPCEFDGIVITQFPTNIGDDMEGTLSGQIEIYDSTTMTNVPLPYTGSFKITRD